MILKQIASLIIASIIMILLSEYLAVIFSWLDNFHVWLYQITEAIFSNSDIGSILRQSLALLIIPVVCAGIPASLYYLIYRKTMPYLVHLIWAIWLVLVVLTIK